MAVAFGGTKSATPGNGTSVVISGIVLSGSNPVLMASVEINSGTQTVSSVSWSLGSGTPNKVPAQTGSARQEDWWIPAPVTGTGNLTINFSAACDYQASASWFTGADQTAPCTTSAGDSASSTSSGTSQTLTPANLTSSDACYGGQANTVAGDVNGVTPHQTFLNDTTTVNGQAGYNTGTSGVTFSLANSPTTNAAVVLRIIASGGGGTAVTRALSFAVTPAFSVARSGTFARALSWSATSSFSLAGVVGVGRSATWSVAWSGSVARQLVTTLGLAWSIAPAFTVQALKNGLPIVTGFVTQLRLRSNNSHDADPPNWMNL